MRLFNIVKLYQNYIAEDYAEVGIKTQNMQLNSISNSTLRSDTYKNKLKFNL